ncbi:UNVERIFIED_CONTAM: hypothetical protein Sradi_4134900 [Sesamum radiatum]|uniref:Reverse transcriptase Ty1/copia-type domain-containing protein n=1 Tax=Sesamum radiatum TaxID=300843 RepID=A0AAW2P456_SESRA
MTELGCKSWWGGFRGKAIAKFVPIGNENWGDCECDPNFYIIYGFKQTFRSWNICFDEVIRGYDFVNNDFDPCVYKEDLGEASIILRIKIFRDRSKRILGITQNSYAEKVLKRLKIEHSKRGFLPMRHGVKVSKKQFLKTDEELKRMSDIPYASAVGSIQYVVQ